MAEESQIGGRRPTGPLEVRVQAQQLDLLICHLDSWPVLPSAVMRLLDPASSSAGPDELACAIGLDPCLAGRLLHRVARARPGLQIESFSQVADVLGPSGVRSVVLSMGILDEPALADGALDYRQFCKHALAAACAAELIAERSPGALNPATAFLCGLLHDVGKIALALCLPKSYRRVLATAAGRGGSLILLEQEVLGLDHALAGRHLARRWQLPRAAEEAIWLHHQPPAALSVAGASAALVAVVQLADIIARRQRLGFSGNPALPAGVAELAAEVGLAEQDAAAIGEELPARLARRLPEEPARTDEARYRALRGRTAAELARLNEEMSGRSAQLQRQARLLRHVRDFAGRLSPLPTLPALCRQLADLFRQAAELKESDPPVGAFAIAGEGSLTFAMCSPPGQEVFRALPCRQTPTAPSAKVCPATVLDGLLSADGGLSDVLNVPDYVMIPLAAGGLWHGGILLPQREGCAAPYEELAEMLGEIVAFTLSAALARGQADQTAERLAQALQRLAETGEALAQARTLAAVGELAAGAAHELNNPLAVISGRAQLLLEGAADDKDRQAADLIVRKAQEISDIVTDLMSFARPAPPRPKPSPAAALLQAARARFLAKPQPKSPPAAVDIEVRQDCPAVLADPRQIEDVLVELLRNAATAGGSDARITMEAAAVEGSPEVLLRVADKGCGMDPVTLASAFTPFFSHRPAGRGRGMGLARAHRTVAANGGRLWIDSRPGEGTTVFVVLPRAHEAPKP